LKVCHCARLLLLSLLPLLLSGCWSSVELNNRAFVGTMIIDKTDEGIELTLGFPLTSRLTPGLAGGSGSGSSGKPFTFVSRTGVNIDEAFQQLQSDIPRKLTFGQTHAIIIGSAFGRSGIESVLEFASRNPYLRMNINLFIVEGAASDKVANAAVSFERFFVSVVSSFVQNHNLIDTTIKDFMFSNYNGGDALIPVLDFQKEDYATEPEGSGRPGTSGVAVFKQGRMVGKPLNEKQTIGSLAIKSQLRGRLYTLDSPSDGRKISFFTEKAKTSIRPVLTRDGMMIELHSYADANIITSDSDIDLESPDNLIKLQTALEQAANENMTSAVHRTQELGADVFNFGAYISWKYPREWETIEPQWRDYYQNKLHVTVKTDIKLGRTGGSLHSVRSKFQMTTDE
jgi:spore germination protein KC